MFPGLSHILLLPTPWNFPGLEIHFFIFQVLKVFQNACQPCFRFPPAKNQTKTEKISIITATMMLAAYFGSGPFSLDMAIRKMIRS